MPPSTALDKPSKHDNPDLDSRVRLTPLPRLATSTTAGDESSEPRDADRHLAVEAHPSVAARPHSFTRRLGVPFVGLRAFSEADHDIYFGREDEVRTLSSMLRTQHLAALVGGRHSGRTSLIEAGLIGALRRRDGSELWQVARVDVSAGDATLALRDALWVAAEQALESQPSATTRGLRSSAERARLVEACLDGSTDAIERAAQHVLLDDAAKLLLVVEGFEQLARDGGREAQRFVRQLLRAAQPPGRDGRVYVVLVASDQVVGSFSEFPGLASALTGNLLVLQAPTTAQLRSAIEGPLPLNNWSVSHALREQLLQDCARRPHALASLQHALARIARHAVQSGVLDLTGYAAAGCPHDLDAHANERFDGCAEQDLPPLSARRRELARAVFTGLVSTTEGQIGTRAAQLSELAAAASVEVSDKDLLAVVKRFSAPSCALLRVSPADSTAPETRVELAHPELVSEWSRLRQWSQHEFERAETYRALLREAVDEFGQRLGSAEDPTAASLLTGERLAATERWWSDSAPTRSWARRHTDASPERSDELFELVERFIERSRERERKAIDARRRAEAASLAEARRRQRSRRLTMAAAAVVVLGGGALLYETMSDRDSARAAADAAAAKYSAAASENQRLAAEEARLGSSLAARARDIDSLGGQIQLLESERAELIETGAVMQESLDALDERLRLIVRAHDAALLDAQAAHQELDSVRRELELLRQRGSAPLAVPPLSTSPWGAAPETD